ncbi:MAG: DUF4105 domain-containing protein, partial [Sphaerochaetaceae bacterium]
MLVWMKRIIPFLCVIFSLPFLCAMSIKGPDITQPFDSRKELAKYDFASPLPENIETWAEKANISIVIMGPENPLYSWFGHAAIVVSQPGGHSIMYDYGIFDNSKKGFYWNFLRGRMLYNIWATDADWRTNLEMEGGRSVTEYRLELSPQAKYQIMEFLKRNALEENNTYLYHFYKDNCATRLRDIVDAATNGEFQKWAKKQDLEGTYRSWAERSLGHHFFTDWFLNFLQGPEIDHRVSLWEEMFLPQRLGDALMRYEPLHATRIVYQEQDYEKIPIKTSGHPVSNDLQAFVFGLSLALFCLLVWKKQWIGIWKTCNFLISLILGLCGLILFYAVCFSDLDVTWFNESLLLVNPLLLLGAFWIFRHPSRTAGMLRGEAYLAVALVILKGLFPTLFSQDNIQTILLVLPYYLTGFVKADFPTQRKRREKP